MRRFIAFPLTLLVIGFALVTGALIAVSSLKRLIDPVSNTLLSVLMAVTMALAVVLAYKGYKRWVEREADSELALSGAPVELGLGLLAGFQLFSGITGTVALLGGFEVLGLRGAGQIWSMLSLALVSGVLEEILFRGLMLRLLERMTGTWIALALTSAFFGFGHVMNPDATWFAGFAITVEAGILLGAAYLLTRRLWLAIGIHAAWNFTQGWVFSVPVSGGDAPLGLLMTRRMGPDWLTGGAFGLEASVVAMILAMLAGLALLRAAIRRGRIVPPMWVKS